MNFEQARFNMVEQQIRTWNVLDTAVLQALNQLPRELFVPAAYQSLAYTDTEIPLGHGQVMLPPRVDARLVHDLNLTGAETVLEIGSGHGYLTALLAQRSQRVIGLEIVPELAAQAQRNLAQASIGNAQVRVADGSCEVPAECPLDAIVLGGSVSEVPASLLSQLKTGGKLLAIVGEDPIMQAVLFTRVGAEQWSSRALWDTVAPALTGFPQPSRFKF
ncbi:MAG: protein-L-isoaspartate O-methyltransferase [Alphaproteobacteria bacterium]|nr:protein-L-isoaspartate O-methyltransferase [Alphaproteobacteria bacterium]